MFDEADEFSIEMSDESAALEFFVTYDLAFRVKPGAKVAFFCGLGVLNIINSHDSP